MPLVVDGDVFPVDVGDGQAELADDAAVAADREEQGGVARVVVDPEDTRVPPALDDARRLGNELLIQPAHPSREETAPPT